MAAPNKVKTPLQALEEWFVLTNPKLREAWMRKQQREVLWETTAWPIRWFINFLDIVTIVFRIFIVLPVTVATTAAGLYIAWQVLVVGVTFTVAAASVYAVVSPIVEEAAKLRAHAVTSAPAQGEAWKVISQACTAEKCPDARLLYAIWETETHQTDCQQWRVKSFPNPCASSAGAQGPFQFMPATWPTYADPDWDRWDLYDSARAAARMTTVLGLYEEKTQDGFAKKFSGKPCWNCGQDGYDQGVKVWNRWQALKQNALVLVMPADGLVVTQGFNQPYPSGTPFGLAGKPHAYGTDLAKPEGGSFDVSAVVDGTIADIYLTPDAGLVMRLVPDSAPSFEVQYWHLGSVVVKPGDHVKTGDPIGQATGAGQSTGPHLHLRVLQDGVDVDPMSFMAQP